MAWTITATIDEVYKVRHQMGDELVVVKLACESDASGTDTQLDSVMADMDWDSILGGWLYEMVVNPGTGDDEPSATFDIDIEDGIDRHILDTDDNAVSGASSHGGSDTLGYFPVIEKDTAFVSETLGNGKTCDVYLKILKG
jgi:hypothetical protein